MPELRFLPTFPSILLLASLLSIYCQSSKSWNYTGEFTYIYSFLFHLLNLTQPFEGGTALRLSTPLIGEDRRIYACSYKTLFAFESNGSIAWSLDLDFACNLRMPPVLGSRGTVIDLKHSFVFISLKSCVSDVV